MKTEPSMEALKADRDKLLKKILAKQIKLMNGSGSCRYNIELVGHVQSVGRVDVLNHCESDYIRMDYNYNSREHIQSDISKLHTWLEDLEKEKEAGKRI